MKRKMLTAGLFLAVSVLNAQDWQPKTWQKYVIEQKVKSDTLCASQTIMSYRRADDVKIAPQAFRCGPFYVPDPPSLFAEQEKALERVRWEDRDYILNRVDKIKDIPIQIAHGRLDFNTRVSSAYRLSEKLNNCELIIVEGVGHSPFTKKMSEVLIKFLEDIKEL